MSSLLTSNALVQKCYTETAIPKNTLVKLNGYNSEFDLPIVTRVSGVSNPTVIGITTEEITDTGVSTEVIFKGLISVNSLPSGTYVNSEIYWDTTTQDFTSDTTDYFVGWLSEVFPNQKIYVNI